MEIVREMFPVIQNKKFSKTELLTQDSGQHTNNKAELTGVKGIFRENIIIRIDLKYINE